MKKVWIFGDSTSCENMRDPQSFEQGWTHFFKDLLNDEIEYRNVAVGGTTLKWNYHCEAYQKGEIHQNIREDSNWYKIVSEVEEGDFFVFFTGGINDHGQIGSDKYCPCPDGDYIIDDFFQIFKNRDVFMYVGKGFGTHRFCTVRSTVKEYCEILSEMINDIKLKGAIPMLARGTGKYFKRNDNDFDVFAASHEYMEALPDVAKATETPYFDIGGIFEKGFSEKGYQYMMDNYFMTVNAMKLLSEKYGREQKRDWNDNCHHNIDGAKLICDIFVEEVKKSDYGLKDYLK